MDVMRKILYIAVFAALFASGCTRNEGAAPARERVRVRLNGLMKPGGAATRSEGLVNPATPIVDGEGLPPYQMQIGIITIENTADLAAAEIDWNDPATAYLDRGFFGGEIPYEDPIDNGNIEYTNRAGDALQTVFYDETGTFYYLVAFYPYNAIHDIDRVDEDEQKAMILNAELGAAVLFDVDGSQDIMSTGLGKGNVESENGMIDLLVFKHRLTCLRCLFVAESAEAKEIYGDITAVKLAGQPDKLGVSIGISALGTGDPVFDVEAADIGVEVSYIDYPAVRKEPDGSELTGNLPLPDTYTPAAAVPFGYLLAKPAQTYTFKIYTSVRGPLNPLEVTYDFSSATPALPVAEPGVIYNLTFKLLESASIVLTAVAADEWWLDQTYD